MNRKPLRIWVEDEIDGQSISLEHVPLSLLKDFARDAEQFLKGSDDEVTDEDLLVRVRTGSLEVQPIREQWPSVYRDIAVLEANHDVSAIDVKRAEVVLRWQKKATGKRRYFATDGITTIVVSEMTAFFASDSSLWMPVKRKIVGEVQDMGGVRKANVHLKTRRGGMVIASDHKTLAQEKDNRLYKTVLVTVSAEENLVTGALRNARLISFHDYRPSLDSPAYRAMHEAGEKAWGDVTSSSDWVRRHREG